MVRADVSFFLYYFFGRIHVKKHLNKQILNCFSFILGQKITRQDGEWSIPSSLNGIVEFAMGISSFPLPPRKIYVSDLKAPNPIDEVVVDKKVSASDAEKGHVVVQTIEELYNVPATWNYNSSSSLCLAEFQHALAFWNSDLLAFQKGTVSMN